MKKFVGITVVALIASLLAFASPATAHDALIEAEIVCDEATNTAVISYVSTAWAGNGTDASRTNPQIDIYVAYQPADSGAYTAPDFSFSGTLPIPAGSEVGDTVAVTTQVVGDWGNGVAGGGGSGTWIQIPDLDCDPPDDPETGRFTGGGFQISDDAKVTRGLTIHCDLVLSNNLQINWPKGVKFHMNEHLTTIECSDDPAIGQAPPEAGIDTLVGVGTGRYNGVDGYIVEFTLIDGGEPGVNDMMSIRIYPEGDPGSPVLDVPLSNMDGGNLQAHDDQPHRGRG